MTLTPSLADVSAPVSARVGGHPMDSSRVLQTLMRISRGRGDGPESNDPLAGIVPRHALRTLLSALQYRDPGTVQHSRRVALLAVGMAEYLGWESRGLKVLEVAGLLHDVGKIGVPDNVLHKPGPLSEDEIELVTVHHHIAVDVLQACRVDREVLQILGQVFHARGGSRPHGVGESPHLGARILRVADAYDAIHRDQSHRRGRSHADVMEELKSGAGSQFDGNVVSALERWIGFEGHPYEQMDDVDDGVAAAEESQSLEDALEAHALCNVFSYLYLLETIYDGFYLVDADMKYVVWSRGVEKLLGHPSRAMLGQSWNGRTLAYSDSGRALPDADCPLKMVVETGRNACREVSVHHGDGRWVEVEVQAVPVRDETGRVLGAAEIFRDRSRSGRKPREYRELKLAASRDSMTHLANRGELETQLTLLVSEFVAGEETDPFSLIFLDIDFFKGINDTYGHVVGDQVIVDLARLLQNETYSGELVSRYGGEEFVLLCPGTDLVQAEQRAERLRIAIQRARIGGLEDFRVTASFGAATIEPGDSVESFVRRADKALYVSKGNGRNRTTSLTSEELLHRDGDANSPEAATERPFHRRIRFTACIEADMVIYKLGGFVNDMGARIVEVTPERTVIRLGHRRFLPGWGHTDARRPVELVVEFARGTQAARSASRAAAGRVEVVAEVAPLGWVRRDEVFQSRARRVLNALRSYFVANELA